MTDPAREERSDTSDEAAESFASYLAKRLIGEKRFRRGVPDEASLLAERSDLVLAYADMNLALVAILDGEASRPERFPFSRDELVEVGRACLKYTGTINGAKLPVVVTLYEIGSGPPGEETLARLRSLKKSVPGSDKVVINYLYVDMESKAVHSGAIFNGLLRGRRWLEAVVREPRRRDADRVPIEAALPSREGKPVATIALLGFLVAMFALEQAARVGNVRPGLLGLDTATLLAVGGMNARLVRDGEVHRMLSAAFLHGDLFHLLLNGVALGLAGFFLEALLGASWFVVLFLVGALGGSLMGLLVNPDNLVSVGASGAVMGLLAAAVVSAMRFPPGGTRTRIQMQMLQFLIPSLIPLATHRQAGQVDYAAHFGGAIAGALAGVALLRIWPKDQEQPRFQRGARGMAVLGGLAVATTLFLVQSRYAAHAAEFGFDVASLLVEDGKIPPDTATAKRDLDTWGANRPRDPRVHLFRGLRLVDAGRIPEAQAEWRAALAERQILDRAFGNRKLETTLRSLLAQTLVQDGRQEEAKAVAAPVCSVAEGPAAETFRGLHLCP